MSCGDCLRLMRVVEAQANEIRLLAARLAVLEADHRETRTVASFAAGLYLRQRERVRVMAGGLPERRSLALEGEVIR